MEQLDSEYRKNSDSVLLQRKHACCLSTEAGNIHVARQRKHKNTHVAWGKLVQAPVIGITHGVVVGLGRHPLRRLMQDRAHGCECCRVTDDLTPMSQSNNGLHQLHQGPMIDSASREGVHAGLCDLACRHPHAH